MQFQRSSLWPWFFALAVGLPALPSRVLAAEDLPRGPAAFSPLTANVGEKVPSEDPVIKDLHSLGLIEGRTNIFRSASPVRDFVAGKQRPRNLASLWRKPRRRKSG